MSIIGIPVKITKPAYAQKLLDGEIYMNSLSYFRNAKNNCQSDINEGVIKTIDPSIGDAFLNSLPEDLKKVMCLPRYFDTTFSPYIKVYCMYDLRYDTDKKEYIIPDKRLKEFDDDSLSVVIIKNQGEFYKRLINGLNKKLGINNYKLKIDCIHYYKPDEYGEKDCFCKTESYNWQQEIRIAVAQLNPNETKLDQEGRILKSFIQDEKPLIFSIGSINDIAYIITIDDFLNLKNIPTVS